MLATTTKCADKITNTEPKQHFTNWSRYRQEQFKLLLGIFLRVNYYLSGHNSSQQSKGKLIFETHFDLKNIPGWPNYGELIGSQMPTDKLFIQVKQVLPLWIWLILWQLITSPLFQYTPNEIIIFWILVLSICLSPSINQYQNYLLFFLVLYEHADILFSLRK